MIRLSTFLGLRVPDVVYEVYTDLHSHVHRIWPRVRVIHGYVHVVLARVHDVQLMYTCTHLRDYKAITTDT